MYNYNVNFNGWLKTISSTSLNGNKQYYKKSNCSILTRSSDRKYYNVIVCGNTYSDGIENAKDYKLRLKPCMKINSGNGTQADPFEITNTCID